MPGEAVAHTLEAGPVLLGPEEAGHALAVEGGVVGAAAAGHLVPDLEVDGELGERRVHRRDGRGEHGLHALDAEEAALVVGAAVVHEAGGDPVELLVAEALYVAAAAEQPLLLTGPEAEADGASGLDARGHQDAGRLEGHGRARAVVLGALGSRTVPRVEVGGDDHDLVGELRTADLGDGVEDAEGALGEVVPEVGLDLDLLPVREARVDGVVVLTSDGDLDVGGKGLHGQLPPAADPAGGDLVPRAAGQLAEEGELLEGLPDHAALLALGLGGVAVAVATTAALLGQEPGALKLVADGLELLHGLGLLHDPAADGAVGAGAPGAGGELDLTLDGADHLDAARTAVEADGDLAPALQPGARQAQLREAVTGPHVGALEGRGAGEARSDLLADVGQGLPDLGVVLPLVDDRGDHLRHGGDVVRRRIGGRVLGAGAGGRAEQDRNEDGPGGKERERHQCWGV